MSETSKTWLFQTFPWRNERGAWAYWDGSAWIALLDRHEIAVYQESHQRLAGLVCPICRSGTGRDWDSTWPLDNGVTWRGWPSHKHCWEWAFYGRPQHDPFAAIPNGGLVEITPEGKVRAVPTGYAALDAKAQEAVNARLERKMAEAVRKLQEDLRKFDTLPGGMFYEAPAGEPAEPPKPPEPRRCRWAAGVRLATLSVSDLASMVDPERETGWGAELIRWCAEVRTEYARKTREWPRCEEGGTVEVDLRRAPNPGSLHEAVLICDRCEKVSA